ncbi:MAG: aspartate kinase, partial [Leptospiraceae bacterium]|nr:aspartate kinase [Leptospiraceae bacterium]MCB1175682.1 aspartate kinase [Leptospiraceae bacterium]
MSIIVQKYGGTSLMDTDRIRNVANRIRTYHDQGHQLCVVLSAMGHTTDGLVAMATELNPHPARREMDMLLSTGEQVSIALMAMTLEAMQVPAISFTGGQVGIVTDGNFSEARIEKINVDVIQKNMQAGKVCIVAGFQGIDT